MIKVLRLTYKNVSGTGKQIFADVDKESDAVEGIIPKHHTILQATGLLGYEPWVQFEPTEHSNMMETVFRQMVDAWNEKHGQ